MINKAGIKFALYMFLMQLSAVIVISGVLVNYSVALAKSVFLGVLLGITPNVLVAFFVFIDQRAIAAKLIMRRFYRAEFLKIIVSMLAFALIFNYFSVQPFYFLLSYVLAQLSFLLIGFFESYFCIGIN